MWENDLLWLLLSWANFMYNPVSIIAVPKKSVAVLTLGPWFLEIRSWPNWLAQISTRGAGEGVKRKESLVLIYTGPCNLSRGAAVLRLPAAALSGSSLGLRSGVNYSWAVFFEATCAEVSCDNFVSNKRFCRVHGFATKRMDTEQRYVRRPWLKRFGAVHEGRSESNSSSLDGHWFGQYTQRCK